MRKIALLAALAVSAVALVVAPAGSAGSTSLAAETTSVALVHGIPGAGGFPVDIYVVNNLKRYTFKNVTFGTAATLETLTKARTQPGFVYVGILPAGSIDNGRFDKPILQSAFWLGWGQSRSVVAHLTATGSPKLTTFLNDVVTEGDKGQVQVFHAAQAPQVGVYVPVSPPIAITTGFVNGQSATLEAAPGTYPAVVTAPGNPSAVLFPAPPAAPLSVPLQANKTTLAFAVGVFPSTFQVLPLVINAR